jgi:hypothetical protein
MKRAKLTIGTLLAIILLATQVLAVGAAPVNQEDTPITGKVDNIVIETNPDTGETIVLVTLTDETGVTQTVQLSLETAIAFEPVPLVTIDEMGTPVVNELAINTTVEIDPSTIILGESEESKQHPVASALSDFFSDIFGVDYDMVMDYHDNGVGFGVIAQALWMTNALCEGAECEGTETLALILDAKQNKDYSLITLPDGSAPQNWGQFRKAVMKDRDKAKENLGAIMSGRAEKPGEDEALLNSMKGKELKKQNGADNSFNENGNTKGNNSVGNNGNNKSDKNNNGKGKSKDKGKGKNK